MSLMQRYADIFGLDIKDVKAWINDYASGSVPEPVKEWMEPTKEERIESIKNYVERCVNDSLTSKIQISSEANRIEESKLAKAIECPF